MLSCMIIIAKVLHDAHSSFAEAREADYDTYS